MYLVENGLIMHTSRQQTVKSKTTSFPFVGGASNFKQKKFTIQLAEASQIHPSQNDSTKPILSL